MQCRRAPGVWGLPGPLLGPGRPTRPGGREGERGLSWSRWRGGGRGVGRTSERVARVLLRGGALQLLVDERGVLDEGLELDRRHARPAAGMPAVSPPLPRRGMRRGNPVPRRAYPRRAAAAAAPGTVPGTVPKVRPFLPSAATPRRPPPPRRPAPRVGWRSTQRDVCLVPTRPGSGSHSPSHPLRVVGGLGGPGRRTPGGGVGNPEEPGRPPKAPARARKEQCEGSV